MKRRLLALVALVLAVPALVAFVITPLAVEPQLGLGLALIAAALAIGRSQRIVVTHLLAVCSVAASLRYLYWRVSSTLEFGSVAAAVCGGLLLFAELYAFVILLLGYFQTVQPLERHPVAMPADRSTWPIVDVFVPTYNEPPEVVRPTVLAALALDWPRDKLRVHLLDDGKRPSLRAFAVEAGANYIARADNRHAKAGNLNHALGVTSGELIAIFDCDHIAARSFLQLTVGCFVRDDKLAVVQTPHHFYNPDPIERNMDQFRRVPNEGELFYGLVQRGNDFWNASFFCGSCAVIRRTALSSVGGVQTDSITEDALTALRLQRRGWSTAYIGIRQAAGLATDTLGAHIGQRIRWAQGMAQILRVDNPLLGRGLGWGQRLCYLNAMMHFLYGLPRLVFLAAPLAYLLFGMHICHTSASLLIAYVLPHLALARLVNARTTSGFRNAFWDQVYETVLAFYILLPTTFGLLRPRAAVFKVTVKGEMIERGGLDRRLARPYATLFFLLAVGLAFGVVRLFLWGDDEAGTVLINCAWTLGSMAMLGAALSVAWETRQRRRTHRVQCRLGAMMTDSSGHTRSAQTVELSLGGASVLLDEAMELAVGEPVRLGLFVEGREHSFALRVAGTAGRSLRLAFETLSLDEESRLVQVLFGRPDAWLDWEKGRAVDHLAASYRTITATGIAALRRIAASEKRLVAAAAFAIGLAGTSFLFLQTGFRLAPIADRFAHLAHDLAERASTLAVPSRNDP